MPKRKAPNPILQWPSTKALKKLLTRRRGVTVAVACEKLGGLSTHTVRGHISRLRAAGVDVVRTTTPSAGRCSAFAGGESSQNGSFRRSLH
jgi:predicted ArsR family transcriptional regulator